MNKSVHVNQNFGGMYLGDSPEARVKSAINELLIILSKGEPMGGLKNRRPSPAVLDKISHNNIKNKKHIVQQYVDRSSTIERAFVEFDQLFPFGKSKILSNLRDLYYEALDEVGVDYLSSDHIDMDKIRDSSDQIIEFITSTLKKVCMTSMNASSFREEIEVGVNVVVAHAFIECLILEAPNK